MAKHMVLTYLYFRILKISHWPCHSLDLSIKHDAMAMEIPPFFTATYRYWGSRSSMCHGFHNYVRLPGRFIATAAMGQTSWLLVTLSCHARAMLVPCSLWFQSREQLIQKWSSGTCEMYNFYQSLLISRNTAYTMVVISWFRLSTSTTVDGCEILHQFF